MLLITPGPYEYRLPPDSESWRFVFVTLCGEGLVGVWRWIIEKTGPVAVLPDDSEPVLLACEICRRGQAGAFDDLFLSADFAHRLAVSLSAAVLPGQHPAAIPPELSEARDFLVAHMADPLLSIPDVARAVGVGTNRLIRLFRDHTGTTPRAFLEQRRVERACFLLSATAMTVCKISETCGFSSANYFTKVFRRTLGIPPGTYRRKCS
jgi:AraC-like DNA-binding protein